MFLFNCSEIWGFDEIRRIYGIFSHFIGDPVKISILDSKDFLGISQEPHHNPILISHKATKKIGYPFTAEYLIVNCKLKIANLKLNIQN